MKIVLVMVAGFLGIFFLGTSAISSAKPKQKGTGIGARVNAPNGVTAFPVGAIGNAFVSIIGATTKATGNGTFAATDSSVKSGSSTGTIIANDSQLMEPSSTTVTSPNGMVADYSTLDQHPAVATIDSSNQNVSVGVDNSPTVAPSDFVTSID
jgi:hypothetical protein